jgi:DNA ligase-4
MASGKLFHQLSSDTEQPPQAKKRKAASTVEKPRGVASQFRHTDVSDVHEVSSIFAGKEFCVINGTRGLSKEDAERKIAEV